MTTETTAPTIPSLRTEFVELFAMATRVEGYLANQEARDMFREQLATAQGPDGIREVLTRWGA